METVKLYSMADDQRGFEYEPVSGGYREIRWSTARDKDGVCGFGDSRMIGVRRKTEVFAALYARADLLHVALPPQSFTWPGTARARRKTWLSRVKSFEISMGDEMPVNFFYTFIDSQHEFPGPEAMDIFYMIAWKTSTPEIVQETITLWQNMARSRGIS
ncbi:MAG TPA: hypothetical protein VF911_01300 [Thermoanaerobaculia bacterium]